jgi:proteasome lid subunit RPN8/RPN11
VSHPDIRELQKLEQEERDSPEVHQTFRVYFDEEAFDHLTGHGLEDTSTEVGGVLAGHLLRDRSGPYIHVQAIIRAEHAEGSVAEFKITHTAWEHINGVMDKDHEDCRILGWYHTHPGFGIFLSDKDLFIQESFFNLPFQVALVFDPKAREHGVYAWKDGHPWRLRHYFIGNREHVWDGQRTSPVGEKKLQDDNLTSEAEQMVSEVSEHETDVSRSSATSSNERSSGEMSLWSWALLLVFLLLGLFGGWLFGTTTAWRKTQELMAEAVKQQAQCETLAYQRLNSNLLAMVRMQMDDEETLRPVAGVHSALTVALEKFRKKKGADSKKGLQEIDHQLDLLGRWVQARGSAEASLRRLERVSRNRNVDPALLEKRQKRLTEGLAGLHSEVAAFVGKQDVSLARRLLMAAARLDRQGHARYNSVYKAIVPDGSLPALDHGKQKAVSGSAKPKTGSDDEPPKPTGK